MPTRICIDVDLTLVDETAKLRPGAVDALKSLRAEGYSLILWSYCGDSYARSVAKTHDLLDLFDGFAAKPDLAIDDEPEALSRLPVVDALEGRGGARNWKSLGLFASALARGIDNRVSWESVPAWIKEMLNDRADMGMGAQSAFAIWEQRDAFIRWPQRGLLLMDGITRHPDGENPDCYDYPAELIAEILRAGLLVDRRSNGPAILAFQLAGGDRPRRPPPSTWAWSIHHIYDGQHPRHAGERVPRAVSDPTLFSHSAGLVAVHPIADYVAMKVPLLAWLLRWEAFRRFDFDPMRIFQRA